MIVEIASFVAATIAALAFHETGHYLACRKQKLPTKSGVDKKGFYVSHEPTSLKNRYEIVQWGIAFGYIPFLPLAIYSFEIAIIWLIGWTISNYTEIKLLFMLEKQIEEGEK